MNFEVDSHKHTGADFLSTFKLVFLETAMRVINNIKLILEIIAHLLSCIYLAKGHLLRVSGLCMGHGLGSIRSYKLVSVLEKCDGRTNCRA